MDLIRNKFEINTIQIIFDVYDNILSVFCNIYSLMTILCIKNVKYYPTIILLIFVEFSFFPIGLCAYKLLPESQNQILLKNISNLRVINIKIIPHKPHKLIKNHKS